MLRDPLAVKKLANPFSGQKYLQNPKNIWNHLTYQPLLASHVCECVCVCVIVKVSVLKNDVVV